jgi:NAD(P)-dependent dehydrogenase (short-subunit alcohol dehydrogenase family)
MDLDGRVALVTGGGSGMGRATARRLAEEGMHVCLVDINGDAARAVAEPINGLALTVDVSDAEQVDAAFAQCVERFGGLDLAFLNAGIAIRSGELATLDDDDYHRAVGVNVDGVVFGARAALRAMRARGDGRRGGAIVATSSIAGIDPFAGDPIYTMTKHAVVGFIRALAPNLTAEGIGAHAICPGVTDTGMLSEDTKAFLRSKGIPLVQPEQIADTVVRAATSPLELAGACWVCHPDQPAVAFEFNDVPGPHTVLNVRR